MHPAVCCGAQGEHFTRETVNGGFIHADVPPVPSANLWPFGESFTCYSSPFEPRSVSPTVPSLQTKPGHVGKKTNRHRTFLCTSFGPQPSFYTARPENIILSHTSGRQVHLELLCACTYRCVCREREGGSDRLSNSHRSRCKIKSRGGDF